MDSIYAFGAYCFILGIGIFGGPMLLAGAGQQAAIPLVFGGIGGLIWLLGILFSRH